MMVILFFSFLFCYINCKVGNLCIPNIVYKDDKFFSILLGSKTLGLNVLELHFVMLANHDQNI